MGGFFGSHGFGLQPLPIVLLHHFLRGFAEGVSLTDDRQRPPENCRMRYQGVSGCFVAENVFDGNFADGAVHGAYPVIFFLADRPGAGFFLIFLKIQGAADIGVLDDVVKHFFAHRRHFRTIFLFVGLGFGGYVFFVFVIRLAGKHARRFKIFTVERVFFLKIFQFVEFFFADMVGSVLVKIGGIIAVCLHLVIVMPVELAVFVLFLPAVEPKFGRLIFVDFAKSGIVLKTLYVVIDGAGGKNGTIAHVKRVAGQHVVGCQSEQRIVLFKLLNAIHNLAQTVQVFAESRFDGAAFFHKVCNRLHVGMRGCLSGKAFDVFKLGGRFFLFGADVEHFENICFAFALADGLLNVGYAGNMFVGLDFVVVIARPHGINRVVILGFDTDAFGLVGFAQVVEGDGFVAGGQTAAGAHVQGGLHVFVVGVGNADVGFLPFRAFLIFYAFFGLEKFIGFVKTPQLFFGRGSIKIFPVIGIRHHGFFGFACGRLVVGGGSGRSFFRLAGVCFNFGGVADGRFCMKTFHKTVQKAGFGTHVAQRFARPVRGCDHVRINFRRFRLNLF